MKLLRKKTAGETVPALCSICGGASAYSKRENCTPCELNQRRKTSREELKPIFQKAASEPVVEPAATPAAPRSTSTNPDDILYG